MAESFTAPAPGPPASYVAREWSVWRDRGVWLAIGPLFALSVGLGLLSDGAYHDDDLTHFLMARWSRWFPGYLLHIWGRPGLTIPLASVSWIGDSQTAWHLARVLSALATAASAMFAADVAGRIGIRRRWIVVILLYAQPLAMLLSFTTLTENWTALYLIAAVALLYRERLLLGSLVFSCALVSRHEAIILLPLWCGAVWMRRVSVGRGVVTLATSLWAPLAHNVAFFLVYDEWPVRVYFEATGSTQYLPTGWLTYIPQTFYAIPPVLGALAILGGGEVLRRRAFLVVAIPAVFWATQAVLRAFGLFASGGYARFLVSVAPFVALLAAAGLESCFRGRRLRAACIVCAGLLALGWLAIELECASGRWVPPNWVPGTLRVTASALVLICLAAAFTRADRSRAIVPLAAVMLMATCLLQIIALVRPLRLSAEARAVHGLCVWLHREGLGRRPLFATDPWLPYFAGLVENPRARKGPELLASMPEGTIVVWDSTYSPSDFHRIPRELLDTNAAYDELTFRPASSGRSAFRIYQKVAPTTEPVSTLPPYPPDLTSRSRPVRGIYYVRDE